MNDEATQTPVSAVNRPRHQRGSRIVDAAVSKQRSEGSHCQVGNAYPGEPEPVRFRQAAGFRHQPLVHRPYPIGHQPDHRGAGAVSFAQVVHPIPIRDDYASAVQRQNSAVPSRCVHWTNAAAAPTSRAAALAPIVTDIPLEEVVNGTAV